jgi:tRNA(adenine34) deaminase
MKDDFINYALNEAKIAYNLNEVPVGAIIVKNNEIIAKSHNLKRSTNNILNHAEIISIIEASNYIGDWRLNGCEMYITLEPCPMCAGAIVQSRINKIYIGTESNIKSNRELIKNILQNTDADHRVEIEYLNNKECSEILTKFFSSKR